jgi:hypothetical protein
VKIDNLEWITGVFPEKLKVVLEVRRIEGARGNHGLDDFSAQFC